jgi:hypothetical protein
MKKVKRVEIVVDAAHTPRVIELLSHAKVDGYTLIRSVSGSGDRGLRMSDDITGVSNNNYILTTCAPETLEKLMTALRPILRRLGGICLVSDAEWLIHRD